ncbi:MAG: DNA polymerase I, partial [Deltaproteobacteria bacterium]|nr:DNA polymerase I [Deltaproteobacteria bacterium]
DNIPGGPGVGPKTAVPLIQEYGSIENLLKNTSKLKGKLKENLEGHADMARLSKELARLKTDADFPFDPEKFLHRPIDTEACHKLFRELEFSKLLSELAPQTKLPRTGYLLIQEEAELEKLVRVIAKQSILAIDLETDSLDVMKANIAGISLGWKKGEAAYIPVGHIGAKQIPLETVKKILEPLFADENIAKVGQNFKYDLAILKRHGFEVGNISGDTMIASYLLNPAGPHNLDALAQQFLDHRTIRYEEVVGTGKQQKLFTEINLERARDYAAEDADCTWQLAQILEPKLKEEGLESLYRNLEIPLMKILLKMEMTGVAVDAGLLKNLSNEFEAELKSREQKIYDLAGGEGSPTQFNINSPKQLGEILFSKLKLPGGKKTKTGFSTSQDVLEDLSEMHELPALILYYRSLSKLKSTYTDSLQNLINQETGRIHTSFNQTIAATGRLSSSDPNLQNIPIRSLEGRRIREAFIAPKGFQLLSADYSQIELRILAHFTEDESLCEAFQKEKDVHSITAAALYGIKPEEVTKEQRAAGKTLNFSVIYGQSPYGLSKQLKIEVSDAALYIENYFKQYPKVKPFREKILEEARRVGYVATLFGRRRFAPDLLSQNFNIRANAERMAFNTVFQGSAADIIKQAMIDIDRELATVSKEAKMILQVHDELLFEVPQKDLQAVQNFVKEKMEKAHLLKIELRVDCGSGKNWAEAH